MLPMCSSSMCKQHLGSPSSEGAFCMAQVVEMKGPNHFPDLASRHNAWYTSLQLLLLSSWDGAHFPCALRPLTMSLHHHACTECCCLALIVHAVDEEKNVLVEFIYEPQQEGNANSLSMQRHTQEEAQVCWQAVRSKSMLACAWYMRSTCSKEQFPSLQQGA